MWALPGKSMSNSKVNGTFRDMAFGGEARSECDSPEGSMVDRRMAHFVAR